MTLVTGTPLGNVVSQDEIYLEGAPYIYFQDYSATPLNNPDSDSFYWGLSGTSTYPVYNLGCIQDVSFGESVTMNDVRCDTVGVKDTVQKRDYIEITFTLNSPLPLSVISKVMNLGAVTVSSAVEKVGIGNINNNQKWMVYAPKVYDEATGDWLMWHLHKCKFVDAWSIATPSGDKWGITGLKIRAYADETKPSAALFGTIIRADPSEVP